MFSVRTYACAFPRRPCDIGGGSGPGSPETYIFRHTVAGQRRPLTGFPCKALSGTHAKTLKLLMLRRKPTISAQRWKYTISSA